MAWERSDQSQSCRCADTQYGVLVHLLSWQRAQCWGWPLWACLFGLANASVLTTAQVLWTTRQIDKVLESSQCVCSLVDGLLCAPYVFIHIHPVPSSQN
ncbi:hypothetical protein V8C37DRAFT_386339 [Trichoderma ceciliae]